MNFHQNAENKAITSFCSGDIVELKFLESDRLRALCSIYHKPNFLQTMNLCRNTKQYVKFYNKTNSKKCNNQIFQ